MAEAFKKTAAVATATANDAAASRATAAALRLPRTFSRPGVSPYDELQWERRTAAITDAAGKTIFEQKDVEVPVDWSMT
ncbi:MAG TPA: hypothetical protein VJS11_06705, partial [Acidobacteriaceae bacterium]|nr:hypothetical protein [Acidobacteriaceae bacterium]